MSLDQIYEIKLGDVEISNLNVRHSNAIKDLDELAASIKKHGLLQPVVLLGFYDNLPYKLIAGQRRFLAHKTVLKMKTIRAVFAGNLGKVQSTICSLVENFNGWN
ncbi:MAG: ParB N-terminal domain-containing protein [Candidatus Anammoxibacter sp.]